MFRSKLQRVLRTRLQLFPQSRTYNTGYEQAFHQPVPTIRKLSPTLWTLGASGVFYLGCASYEVYRDAQNIKKHDLDDGWFSDGGRSSSTPRTFRQFEAAVSAANAQQQYRSVPEPTGSPLDLWTRIAGADKAIASIIGLNAGLFAACRIVPSVLPHFAHVPASAHNYTLLTSVFGHSGLFHLGFNLWAFYNFGRPVARSRTFDNSASHLTAFFLTTGVVSSLAQHLSSPWASPRHGFSRVARLFVPSLGASGAVMAVIGAFGMAYPQSRIGLMFIPGSLPAEQALGLIALFECYGLFVGIRSLPFGHAAHLSGLAIGAAYVYLDGRRNIWAPTRKFAFEQMQRLNVI